MESSYMRIEVEGRMVMLYLWGEQIVTDPPGLGKLLEHCVEYPYIKVTLYPGGLAPLTRDVGMIRAFIQEHGIGQVLYPLPSPLPPGVVV